MMNESSPCTPYSLSETGSSPKWFTSPDDFLRKTQWLILWRLVFISIFLLVTALLQEKEELPLFPIFFPRLFFLIGLQYFFSILYIAFLFGGKAAPWKAVVQLIHDGFFVTAVVYVTGGIESFFPYLYFLIIVAGGMIFGRPGGILTALYLGFLYGVLLLIQGFDWFSIATGLSGPPSHFSKNYFLYQLVMHLVGFFCVGYFSSIFAEQVRRQRSQLEKQQRNIDQLEELHRIVIENLDIGLITLDNRNQIVSINPAGEKILERTKEEFRNLTLPSFFDGYQEAFSGKDSPLGNRPEIAYTTPGGSKKILGFSITQVKEPLSQGIGQIFSFKDITQIKILEEHLRKVDRLAMLGKMAAGIAHEIRNPLASISGSIQILKDDFGADGARERLLKIISREISRLDLLMNDFLAFTKPVQTFDSDVDLSEFVQEMVELVTTSQKVSPAIIWRMDIPPHLLVNLSRGDLSQVFWNLLTNALQALPGEGTIAIKAQPFKGESEKVWIEIRIGDTGPGIPVSDQTKIFDPFFTTKDYGTGLGLSIVQKIISDRGGRIRVESFLGQGTEFIIHLPNGAGDD